MPGSIPGTSRRELVEVALGHSPADRIIRGARVVNVHTAEIYAADVAIKGDRIAAVGEAPRPGEGTELIEASGRYVLPGLIETHVHHCHSYLGVTEFAAALLQHGITAFADGFYGPAIVGGVEAVAFFKKAFERLPIRLLFLVPVLAYAQNRELGLTPAVAIGAEEMCEMLDWPGCVGLEEPPPYPVLEGDEAVTRLLAATLERRKVITGHAAGLDSVQVQAYAAAGASTDHEMVGADEARERARAGMRLLARQGDPGCHDLANVLPARSRLGIDSRALAFCSDLAGPGKVVDEGTVDHAMRIAIATGIDPVEAIQMATLNAAEALGVEHEMGSVAPGREANLLLVDDLSELAIDEVIAGGRTVVRGDRLVEPLPTTTYPPSLYSTVSLESGTVTRADMTFRVERPDGEVEVRAIGVSEAGSLLTSPERRVIMRVVDGVLTPEPATDIAQLAIIDRLGRGTGIGLGFAQGFGLRSGAFASTVTALTMNLVVAGSNASDMAIAANHLAQTGGGKVVVNDGDVLAEVALPVLGLHSDRDTPALLNEVDRALAALSRLGCRLRDPFSQLEFCFACQDIGDIKLAEEGLMQVRPPRRLEVVLS